MPNDYIDQVKLTDNTVVDIKDTVSGYSKVFEIHATAITGTDYYTLDKSWSDISSAITNGDNLIISNIDATYPYTTINNSGIVFGATLIATDSGSTFALTDGILVINNQGTAMGMAIHMNTTIPTIPSSSAILKGNGSGGVTTATAGTDYQAPISFDGTYSSSNKAATVSTVTNAINALDGGTIGTGGTTKTITSLSQTNGNVSATFNDIAFPVTSVNSQTGAVSLTASDVGAQATLVSGTNIKTINNESLLGSGNISISGGTPEILIVTATRTLANITADTTYADIYAAMVAGKEVIVKYTQDNLTAYIYFYADACPLYTGETIYFWQVESTSGRVQYLSVTNTDYWQFNYLALAPKASPTFTGTPKAPTAAAGTDTTQIATTAFVQTVKPFIATYGTTTYSDITTALSANRAVYCHYVSGEDDIILPYVCTTETGIYVFTNMVGNTCWRFYINSSGTWSNGKTALAATQTTASLAVASWSNKSITVTVSGVTTSNLVIVSPAPASAKTWAACGVICTTQAANKLTFTCDSTPTTALTANIAVWA